MSLTAIPAFGFETSRVHSKQGYIAVMSRTRDSVGHINHNYTTSDQATVSDEQIIKAYTRTNRGKMIAYMPVIGTFIGIIRIVEAFTNKEALPNKFSHMLRGSIEFFSLGFLLIIPDLILTNLRNRNQPIVVV
jgi:hypothetical protein